jgi:chromate transporter
MIYLQLFISFIKVGLFSIGGGYAAIPLIQSEVVLMHGWLSMAEFTNLITIAEMTPGPIAVNSATFVGIRIAGVLGAVIATLGCILPSIIIVSILAYVYHKYRNLTTMQSVLSGLRPAVVALIASAGLSIFLLVAFGGKPYSIGNVEWIGVIIAVSAFVILRKIKCNPILIIGLSGVVGLILQLVTGV